MSLANTMTLKLINRDLIRKVLQSGKIYTKNKLSLESNLSVATCNTIINDLIEDGEIVELEQCPSTGGRPSKQYIINANYQLVVAMYIHKEGQHRSINYSVSNLLNDVIDEDSLDFNTISINEIENTLSFVIKKHNNIKVICLGIPGVIRENSVDFCDFNALSDFPVQKYLSNKLGITILVENDLNATALGYHKLHKMKALESLAYLYYPLRGNPGLGLILNDTIVKGNTYFAGEIAYLPIGVAYNEQGDLQKNSKDFIDYAAKSIVALNCIVNPKIVILSGFLFTKEMIAYIETATNALLPKDHTPDIRYEENIHKSYMAGLTTIALSKLTCKYQLIENL